MSGPINQIPLVVPPVSGSPLSTKISGPEAVQLPKTVSDEMTLELPDVQQTADRESGGQSRQFPIPHRPELHDHSALDVEA